MDVRSYLVDKGWEYKETERQGGPNAIMVCPICHGGDKKEKSFAINLETGAWNCMRINHCGLSGSFYDLQERFGDKPQFIGRETKHKIYSKPKPEIKPISQDQKALTYLYNRGFTDATLQKFRIFTTFKGEVCLPYFKNGNLINVKYRTLDKRMWQEKNAEPCLFNIDSVAAETTTLIITEGEWDCMALDQYGFSSVTSLPAGTNGHTWIDNNWDFLEQFTEIYLCMDNDPAGRQAVATLTKRLGAWRCKSVTFPCKDANDCLVQGITKEMMENRFEHAEEFPPKLLRRAGEFYHEISELFTNPKQANGISTDLPGLDYYLKGWRLGEVTIWTGQSGSGKTTLLNQVCLSLVSRRVTSCVASLELKAKRFLKWAACQAAGTDQVSDKNLLAICSWWQDNLLIWDVSEEVEVSELLYVFEYAARRYGAEHFVIDSLMRVKMEGENEYLSQKEFVAKLMAFAKKHQVHVHLVAHQRKPGADIDKPDKVNVKGASDITDLADNVLSLWRVPPGKKEDGGADAILFVNKNREFGNEGAVKLWFDKRSKRFACKDQEINFHLEDQWG